MEQGGGVGSEQQFPALIGDRDVFKTIQIKQRLIPFRLEVFGGAAISELLLQDQRQPSEWVVMATEDEESCEQAS